MAEISKKIVVIGAGIGGISVAALLQHKGNQVTLLERNPYVGGKCTSVEKNGFIVDCAFHIFSRGENGPLGDINRRIGGDLRWYETKPVGKWYFQNNGWFTVPENFLRAMGSGTSAYIRGVIRPGIVNALRNSLKKYGFAGMLDNVFRIMQCDEGLLQTLDEISLRDFLLQFTDDVSTHRAAATLSFISTVVQYGEVSAGELLYCLMKQLKASSFSYPVGGAREIAASYERVFKEDGGIVRRGCAVKRILVENGKARGVETQDGEEILADVVISNAGIKSTVDLVGAQQLPSEYVAYVDALKYCLSANVVKYGLDCRLPEIPKYFFEYVSDEAPEHMGSFIKNKSSGKDVSYAIIKPTDWDPYLAPAGKEILILGTSGPNAVTPENITYCNEMLDKVEKEMFDFFPRIKDHVQWSQRATIEQISSFTGRSTGECIGLAQCVGQCGVNKPKVQTPVDDLWLVGCDAGARGFGTEQAAASALHVSYLVDGRL